MECERFNDTCEDFAPLSDHERQVIEMLRRVKSGTVIIHIKNGVPISIKAYTLEPIILSEDAQSSFDNSAFLYN